MVSAPQSHVLRVALAYTADDHVLVTVSPSRGAGGGNSLDLELLATDNAKAYVVTLSHSRLARYRASKKSCSESDWEDALRALLLADHPIGGIQATARIADDEEKPTGDEKGYMFIDVRKKVSEHAEPLGTLKLRKSNKAEDSIQLFDWCAAAAGAREKLAQDVSELRQEFDALKTLVAEETAKFKELTRSKQEFEASHDSWLKDLLNEKKVKIRTQEQLLATAHVDPDKLAAANAAFASKPRRSGGAGPSRGSKRKAQAEEGDASADDADKMDLDVDEAPDSHEDDMDEADRATTGSEVASDPELDEPVPKNTVGKKAARALPASAAESSAKTGKAGHNLRDEKLVSPDDSEDEMNAPRRKSPPAKKKPTPALELDPDDVSTASE